jgi:hypothetical protein
VSWISLAQDRALVNTVTDLRVPQNKQLLNCTDKAEWTPFQTHHFSENLVEPGIEPGPLDL